MEQHSKSCARDSKEVVRSISNEEKRGRKLDTFCEEKWVRAMLNKRGGQYVKEELSLFWLTY